MLRVKAVPGYKPLEDQILGGSPPSLSSSLQLCLDASCGSKGVLRLGRNQAGAWACVAPRTSLPDSPDGIQAQECSNNQYAQVGLRIYISV